MLLVLILCIAGSALADEGCLIVNGSGTVNLPADQVSVNLGVSMEAEDLTVLQTQVNGIMDAIYNALLAEGLEKENISTGYIQILPNYKPQEDIRIFSRDGSAAGELSIAGYSMASTLSIFTGDIDRVGSYIDAAFAAGANSLKSISFSLKDDSEARKAALKLAVQDASDKAETIAEASGSELEGILQIREGGTSSYSNSNGARYAMTETAAYGGETAVHAAQISVTANVEITYELK